MQHAPALINAYHPSYEYLCGEIDKYFEVVPFTKKFELIGGEALIRKDLADIVRHVSKYKDKFAEFRITSNGTIVPGDNLILALKDMNVGMGGGGAEMLVDDYGAPSRNAKLVKTKLEENGIRCIYRDYCGDDAYCNGWVVYGEYKKNHTYAEACEIYSKCGLPRKLNLCFAVINGRMHPCMYSYQAMEFGAMPDDPSQYVDLFDTKSDLQEKRDKLAGYINAPLLTACMYCDGLLDDRERFPAAEQASHEEILELRKKLLALRRNVPAATGASDRTNA